MAANARRYGELAPLGESWSKRRQLDVWVATVSLPVIKGVKVQTMSLRKGENTALLAASTVLTVAVQGLAVDVSALLLGLDGKVRSDSDLVFYNHPNQEVCRSLAPLSRRT
ncbi:TerD family protein [Streptomyces nigra]|uniref:TerD family protein n=1 Tax=Streptomyces nigra TaxID=1827580 RepID=UPI0038073862